MLKKFARLYDSTPTDGSSGSKTPIVVKPSISKPVPEDIAKQTFSVEDYEPEQLPEQGTVTDEVGKVVEKKDDKKVTDEKKAPKVTDEKTVVPKDDKKSEDDKKLDEKKDEKKLPSFLKPPGTKKDETKKDELGKEVIKQITPKKIVRDYAGHTTEEVAAFKAMSDESYEFTKKILNQNKELSKLKDSTYLQHENAYLLDPGFQSLRVDQHFAKLEGDIWKEQLTLMKSGKKWKPLTGFKEDGTPIYDAERDPNDQEEEEVRRLMNTAYQIANSKTGEIQAYPSKYQSQTKSDLQAIDEERKKRFAWVANPELLDYSMHIEGLGDRTFKQMREDFISIFPPYLHGNPGVQVAADLMIALRYAQAELEEERAKNKITEIKETEASRAEPSSNGRETSPKKAVHGVVEFSGEPV